MAAASWSVYTGTTAAPFGSIHKDGVRLRMTGGYGRYNYHGTRRLGRHLQQTKFKGQHGFGELLAGYQWQAGRVTLKAFAGGGGIGHVVTPFDPGHAATGTRYGAAVGIEAWYDVTDSIWLSANFGWSSVFQSYKSEFRLGYRLGDQFDLGIEGAGSHDSHYAHGRVGAFAQYKWGAMELRLSGGLLQDHDGKSSAYGTLNLLHTY